MLRALIAALRRFFSRLLARRLLRQQLPRGLAREGLALPAPAREPPPGEFWTVGRRASRLFRLAALPPAPRLSVFDPKRFRLDPATLAPSSAAGPPIRSADANRWVLPALRSRVLDVPWMARNRMPLLAPGAAETFAFFWEQWARRSPGPRGPLQWERPDEVDWAMDECKEQMLIRRDVAKDEHGPAPAEMAAPALGHPLVAWDPEPLPGLLPSKEWVEIADPQALLPPPQQERAVREAYLRWRTLLEALGD